MVPLHAEYVGITGSLNAALLLSQVHYWYLPTAKGQSRLSVVRDGELCLVKSHQELTEETGLTRRQVDTAMKRLIDKGLVSVTIRGFKGAPMRHIVCPAFASVPLKLRCTKTLIGAMLCTAACNGLHTSVQSNTETMAETVASSKDAQPAALVSKVESSAEISGDESMADAKDVLSKYMNKPTAALTGQVKITDLSMLWKKRMALLGSGGFQKPLTGKEVGQLKHVLKAMGDKAHPTLDWALQNWSKFAQNVTIAKGMSAAQVPHVGFFCTHYEVAAQSIADGQPKKVAAILQKDQTPPTKKYAEVGTSPHNQDLAGESDINNTLAALEALKSKG